jgi:hypothetical protein
MSIEIYVDKELKCSVVSNKKMLEYMEKIKELEVEDSPLFLIQETIYHSPVCPQAPKKVPGGNNHIVPIENIKRINNRYNSALDLAGMEKICKRKMQTTGSQCTRECYKYKVCKYHWNVWRKKNPFVDHP